MLLKQLLTTQRALKGVPQSSGNKLQRAYVHAPLPVVQEAGSAPCDKIAETLASTAVAMGSTDDVTVVVMRLGTSSA